MTDVAIRVEQVFKRYRIGAKEERHDTLAGAVTALTAAPLRNLRRLRRLTHFRADEQEAEDVIWALRGVSLEVGVGEVLGIIGRNGAGKTTLLKILCRITEPTAGRAVVCGRVGSLLEVGTGFHPELTGRENVFLNGAVLGMRRPEIERKFDEIVEFSGVERFIDTPVKRYSSGMYLRLAFAVAAHLEPDILLVDEVLAVGDLEFQKKCLGKMQEVGRSGRTVLFVSHNMPAVSGLCDRAILLDDGKIAAAGDVEEVIARYIQVAVRAGSEVRWEREEAPANDVVRLVSVRACDGGGCVPPSFDIRKPIFIEIEYEVVKPRIWFTPSIQLKNEAGVIIFNSNAEYEPDWENAFPTPGLYKSTCCIPGNLLSDGLFVIRVVLFGFTRLPQKGVLVENAISFHVHDSFGADSARERTTRSFPGVVRPKLDWVTESLSAVS
ncbi:MAG: ABC transporter ATP-binding protein [Gemmatimonadetes bacterium]|nr:ABC transporter ATP-binding protein [Gemmatimonadota bacterium]